MKQLLSIILCLFLIQNISAQNRGIQKLYHNKKYTKLLKQAIPKQKDTPNNYILNYYIGKTYYNIGDYNNALKYLNSAKNNANNDKNRELCIYNIAACNYNLNNNQQAISTLKKGTNSSIHEVKTFCKKQLNAMQYSSFFNTWQHVSVKNIRFHFQDKKNTENRAELMEIQQKIAKRAIAFFNKPLTKPIDLYVWSNKNEALNKTNKLLPNYNSKYCIINILNTDTSYQTLSKMLCRRAIKTDFSSMLIQGGLSIYFKNLERNMLKDARNLIPKNHFSLLELWEKPTRYEKNLSYPVGAAFVEFLIMKEGKQKMKEFLKHQTLKHALKVYPNFRVLVTTFEAMLIKN